MRIVIRFDTESGQFFLPVHYNHIIQSFIYRNLSHVIATKYHRDGFKYGKRAYKMFCFSRLMSRQVKYQEKTKTLVFHPPILLKMGAIDTELLESLAIHLMRKRIVRIGGNTCRLSSIEVEAPVKPHKNLTVRALSPISVHRTLYSADGKRKTYYYSPWEREFPELIADNLVRKAKALYEEAKLPELEREGVIKPVRVNSKDQKIIIYRKGNLEYVIKGWTGIYELSLPEPYFEIAYSAGLGARNSMGFGMVEVVNG